MGVLRDHFVFPLSVCRHPGDKRVDKDQWRTNASLIMDLTSRVLWLAVDPPCQNVYQRYTFNIRE